jgi:hypothetical protein
VKNARKEERAADKSLHGTGGFFCYFSTDLANNADDHKKINQSMY